MVTFLRINKDATIIEEQITDINNLYKACGLRKPDGFIKLYSKCNKDYTIELWGRNVGRNNIKNKYTFIFDKDINLYGTCAIVYLFKNKLTDLTVDSLNKIYLEYDNKQNNTDIIENNKIIKDDNSDNDSDNDSDDDSDDDKDLNDSDDISSDSELQPEEYIYSSEEDNNKN